MVGAAIIGQAREAGIGISSFVALGNRADVSGNDLLQYWEGDDAHRRRLHVHRVASATPATSAAWPAGSPGQAGRGREGRPAPGSRASAGPTRPRRCSCADRRDPGADARRDARHRPACSPASRSRAGRRVAIVGNAGGSLAIAADAVVDAGLELAELRRRPGPALGAGPPRGRPLASSTSGCGDGADVERAVGRSCADPGVDSVLVVYAPSLGGTADGGARRRSTAGRQAQPEVAGRGLLLRARRRRRRRPGTGARCSTPSTRRPERSAGSPPTPSGWPQPEGEPPRARRADPRRRGAGPASQDHLARRSPAPRRAGGAWRVARRRSASTTVPTEVVDDGRRGRRRAPRRSATRWCSRRPGATAWPRRPRRASPSTSRARRAARWRGRGWRTTLGDRLRARPGAADGRPGRGRLRRGARPPAGRPGALAAARGARPRRSTPRPTSGCCPSATSRRARLVAGSRLAALLDDDGRGRSRRLLLRGRRAGRGGARDLRAGRSTRSSSRDGRGGDHPGRGDGGADRARSAAAGAPGLTSLSGGGRAPARRGCCAGSAWCRP